MFEMKNDMDLTKELAIEQLVDATNECQGYMWERKNYSTYTQYLFTHEITKTMSICFRIYHYKTHDNHMCNIYMSRRNGMRYVSIFSIEGPKVLELIKVIETSKKSYYEPE